MILNIEAPLGAALISPQRRSGRTYRMLAYALDLAISGLQVNVYCTNPRTMRLNLLKVASDRFPDKQKIETKGNIEFKTVSASDYAKLNDFKDSLVSLCDHFAVGEE